MQFLLRTKLKNIYKGSFRNNDTNNRLLNVIHVLQRCDKVRAIYYYYYYNNGEFCIYIYLDLDTSWPIMKEDTQQQGIRILCNFSYNIILNS